MTNETAVVKKKKNKSHIQRRLIPSYIFLIFWSFISVFPFYWMISAATNKSLDVAQGKLIIGTYLAQNMKALLAAQPLARAMGNSFLYSTVQTLLCLGESDGQLISLLDGADAALPLRLLARRLRL